MGVRDDFVTVANSALTLLMEPAVEARWNEPSALEDFTVGGLAFHLSNQVLHVPQATPTDRAPVSLVDDYYAEADWLGQDASHQVNVFIRERMEEAAAQGVSTVLTNAHDTLGQVRTLIAEAPADLVVEMRGRPLTFDDFLVSRLMELVVHSDDLAVSVGVPTPLVPESAATTVVDLLSRLAIRRYGAITVVRALSRSERAPATISAL
ncbi:DinB family protein [Flindersiella endophytica]